MNKEIVPLHFRVYLLVLSLFAVIPVSVFAQENFNMSLVSRTFAEWATVDDIALDGNFAYVSTRDTGLYILDVSDSANPVVVNSFEIAGGVVVKSLVRDGILYALGWDILNIISVSDPHNPVLLGSYYHPGQNFWFMALAGDCAYLAGYGRYFLVVDISDPQLPQLLTTVSTGTSTMRGLAVDGGLLCTITFESRTFQIYDISNPASPQPLGNFRTHFTPECLAVAGGYAYVGTAYGIFIIDVSVPAMPIPVGYLQSTSIKRIEALDGCALLTSLYDVMLLDLSDPQQPFISYTYAHAFSIRSFAVSGNRLFLGNYHISLNAYVNILDIASPDGFTPVGSYGPLPRTYDLASSGDIVFLAAAGSAVISVNVADPEHPQKLCELPLAVSDGPSLVAGTLLYVVAPQNQVKIIDISDPSNLTLLGSITCPGNVSSMEARDNLLFAASAAGTGIYDVANPAAPATVGFIHTVWLTRRLELAGSILYMSSSSGIGIYDVSDPASPQYVRIVGQNISNYVCLARAGYYLYAATFDGLDVYTCYDPANPQFASRTELPDEVLDIEVAQNRIFVANGYAGIYVLERDSGGFTEITGYYYTRGGAANVAVYGSYVYVANSNSFVILHYGSSGNEDELLPTTGLAGPIRNHPNPFRDQTTISFSLEKASLLKVSVYNLRGQLVRCLGDGTASSGPCEIVWDGRDHEGRKAAPGIYLFRLQGDGIARSGKMYLRR